MGRVLLLFCKQMADERFPEFYFVTIFFSLNAF